MFSKSSIETAAAGLVGFSHSYHEYYTRLSSALKSASSGYYVDNLPGVTFDVIQSTIRTEVKNASLIENEYYEIRDVSGGADFLNVGAASNTVGVTFKATGTTPTAWGTGELKLVSCNNYLANIYNQELLHLVSEFVLKCKDVLRAKELLSNQSIIRGVTVMDGDDLVTKNGRFVGFLLNPINSPNVKIKITKIGMQLDAAQNVTIYLFDSSRNTAVKTHDFTLSSAKTIEWESPATSWYIEYAPTDGGVGQQWLLGYFEDDLTASAYERDFDDDSRHEMFRVYGKYLGVAPVEIPSTELNSTSLPNNDSLNQYISQTMHGLYFKFNVVCDITNILVDNISMFARPLQHAIALRILEDAVKSGSDGIHNPVKTAMLQEWSNTASAIRGQLYGGYDADGKFHKGMVHYLTMDFSNLDKICLKKKETTLRVFPVV